MTATQRAGAPRPQRRRRRPATAATPASTTVSTAAATGRRDPRPVAATSERRPSLPDPDTATEPVREVATFAELGVPAALASVLAERGVTAPFPIQVATVPDALAGRDVLGRGRTGSGKTIAFALPTVARLVASRTRTESTRPRALVLVPTRELANQVHETLAPLAAAVGLRTAIVFGGVGQQPQVAALRRGVDVLVACPGRLEDLVQQGACRLDRVEVTVLDEADHMADLGFLPGVKRLLDRTPADGQRLLFSATLDQGIDVLVKRYLTNPAVHSVDPAVAPVSTMQHHVFAVRAEHKRGLVEHLAGGHGRTLLFTRTKHGAKKLAQQLTTSGIPAVELHGNLSQNARERNLDAFTTGTTRVLVATDIAARGIHVDDVGLVVHVDPPAEHKAYLHRSGRTARAGADGVVVTVMTPDQASDVRALARAAGIRPTVTAVEPGHPAVTELVGPAAPLRHPEPRAAAPAPARSRATSASRSPKPAANPSRPAAQPAGPRGAAQGRGGRGRPSGRRPR